VNIDKWCFINVNMTMIIMMIIDAWPKYCSTVVYPSATNNVTQICYKLQLRGWNVGAQQQQQVCTTLLSYDFFCHIFSFCTVSHYIYLCLKK